MANKPQKELGGTRNMSLGTKIVVGIFAVIMALSMMLPSLIPIFSGSGDDAEQEEQVDVEDEATDEAADGEEADAEAEDAEKADDAEAEGDDAKEADAEGDEKADGDGDDAEKTDDAEGDEKSEDADEDAVPDNETLQSYADQYKDEVAKYKARLEEDPNNLAALLNLGQDYMNWGYSSLYSSSTDEETNFSNKLIKKAKEYFESYLKINESDAVVVQQALCDYYLGNTDDAIDAMKKLSADKPDYPLAWANLGLFYEWQYDYDNAVDAYLKAVELDPDDEYGAKSYGEQRMASINSSRSSFEDLTNEESLGTNATPQEGLPGIIASNAKKS